MVIIVSLLTGSFAFKAEGGVHWIGFALITLSTLAGFLSFTPLRMLIKLPVGMERFRVVAWFIIYGAICATSFLLLLTIFDRSALAWFIIPAAILTGTYLWFSTSKKQKTTTVEVSGIIGLALAGPAAGYVQLNEITAEVIVLYLLLVIWFIDRMITAGGVLALLRSGAKPATAGQRVSALSWELTVHGIALFCVLAVIGLSESAPIVLILPFGLATARNVYDVFSSKQITDPMRVGFAEMRLGFLFSFLLIICWRLYQ